MDEQFDVIITELSKRSNDFFFIQIGANDGIKADPIFLYVKKYSWKGILVEPVSYIFNQLKKNYNGVENLIFENIAICEKDGFKDFYRLKQIKNEDVPLWYDEIGSFLKENVTKHKDKIKNFYKYLITEKIPCLTLNSLLIKHSIKKIDLLVIDTEGYDYYILKQIPFDKIKPSIIIFEDRHLSLEQKKYYYELLIKERYSIIHSVDCLAYLPILIYLLVLTKIFSNSSTTFKNINNPSFIYAWKRK